jgi:hypothetical protein
MAAPIAGNHVLSASGPKRIDTQPPACTDHSAVVAQQGAQTPESGLLLQIKNGSYSMHAVSDGGVLVPSKEKPWETLQVVPMDLALVAIGEPDVLPDIIGPARTDKGFNFGLFNNAWGTNYVLWTPYGHGRGSRMKSRCISQTDLLCGTVSVALRGADTEPCEVAGPVLVHLLRLVTRSNIPTWNGLLTWRLSLAVACRFAPHRRLSGAAAMLLILQAHPNNRCFHVSLLAMRADK